MRSLGYDRYGAGGGDFGAGIATFMALVDPGPLIGLHLTNLELTPYTGPGSRALSPPEQEYLGQARLWGQAEHGYYAIQSTKPQTLGYALNDSPAGLAAWILEKWRSWADSDGDLDGRFSREFLLTTVTIYWVTQTRSARRTSSTCPPGSPCSPTSSPTTVNLPASGPNASTTSAGGHPCRPADISPPPR